MRIFASLLLTLSLTACSKGMSEECEETSECAGTMECVFFSAVVEGEGDEPDTCEIQAVAQCEPTCTTDADCADVTDRGGLPMPICGRDCDGLGLCVPDI